MRLVFALAALLGLAACSQGGNVPVSVVMPPVTVTGPDGVQATVSSSGGLEVALPTQPIGIAPGVAVQASGPITVAVPAK